MNPQTSLKMSLGVGIDLSSLMYNRIFLNLRQFCIILYISSLFGLGRDLIKVRISINIKNKIILILLKMPIIPK